MNEPLTDDELTAYRGYTWGVYDTSRLFATIDQLRENFQLSREALVKAEEECEQLRAERDEAQRCNRDYEARCKALELESASLGSRLSLAIEGLREGVDANEAHALRGRGPIIGIADGLRRTLAKIEEQ